MASLHLACSASLQAGRMAIAAAARPPRRLQTAAVCRRAPAPPAAAAQGGGSRALPATRQAAHQQRLEGTARKVLQDAGMLVAADARTETAEIERLNSARVRVVATLLGAGMSPAGAAAQLQGGRLLWYFDVQDLETCMEGVRNLMRGVKKNKSSLTNELGSNAVSLVRAGYSPASFTARCDLAADLAADAAPGLKDRGSVLRMSLGADRGLRWLLGGARDAGKLRAVFTALQQHLGWSAQQAGAALLGLGLQAGPDGKQRVSCEGAPRLQLHHTSVQHIEQMSGLLRQYGLQGNELVSATFVANTDWTTAQPVDAALTIAALKDAGLPPRQAAELWLAAGRADAADPVLHNTWVQLAQANLPAAQLEAFTEPLTGGSARASRAAGSLLLLRLLLGTWPAAVRAAATDASLLALVEWPTPEQQADSLAVPQLELDAAEMLQLARLVAQQPAGLAGCAATLQLLLGSAEAAWRALLADASLAQLPAPDDDVAGVCKELRAAAMGQQRLLLLAKSVFAGDDSASPTQALGSLQLLTKLLGSTGAAVEAAAADIQLLDLPYYDQNMQTVFARLSTAGLTHKQLRRLASICNDHDDEVDRLIWMADELYAGDWRAAMLEFLRGWRVYVGCLCRLRAMLDTLTSVGLEVANDTGRQHVLRHIKKPGADVMLELHGLGPCGTPAQQRTSAALASLEQHGFRVTGSKTVQLIERLAADRNVFSCSVFLSTHYVDVFSSSTRCHIFDGEDWRSEGSQADGSGRHAAETQPALTS